MVGLIFDAFANTGRSVLRLYLMFTMLVFPLMVIGCSITATDDLAANHAAAGTQVADLRTTATVQSARAQITLDFVGTREGFVATHSNLLQLTLIANGTPETYMQTVQARYINEMPTATLTPILPTVETGDGNADPIPPVQFSQSDPTPPPTIPGVTPFSMLQTVPPSRTPRPTLDPNRPTVSNPQLATSPGDDDCGSGVSRQFTTNTTEIYLTIFVHQSQPNTLFETRWFREDELVGVVGFTPDFAINEACIWLFADQTDFAFEAGNYSVIMDANGQPITDELSFTIVE